jgi:hypothetical protein
MWWLHSGTARTPFALFYRSLDPFSLLYADEDMLFGRTVALCLAVGASFALPAQPSPEKTTTTGIDRADIQAVIGLARVAPPEFGADALITLVETGLIADHRQQHDLLEEAFTLAGNAQEKIALKRGGGDSAMTAALHGAFRNSIDQASLRSRAVQAMMRFDNRSAREMFERIELPLQPSTGCDQQIVPDLTIYYVTMLEVARITPGREQLETFFAAHMPRFQSAAQITPFARVLMQLREIERMPPVIDAFSARLTELAPDRRVFSTYFEQAIEAIGQLVTSSPPSTRERLIERSRNWVLRNIDNGICAEPAKYTIGFDGSRRPAATIDPATQFNQEVAWHARNGRIDSAVTKQDSASSIPNSPEYFDFFRTHLMLARDDEGALELSRWRSETEDYISRLSAWSWPAAQVESKVVSFRDPSDDEPVDVVAQTISPAHPDSTTPTRSTTDARNFFLEKSDLLTHVLFIERHAPSAPRSGPVTISWSGAPTPTGPRVAIPSRDRVLAALVSTFDSEAARKVYEDRRLLWFSPVRDLLATPGIPDLYAASNHPVLTLYGHLAKLVALR